MITVFDVISKLEQIYPDYPAVVVIPFACLFVWYVFGGLYHGYRFAKEK